MVAVSATPRRTVHRPALVLLVVVLAFTALALGWWQWERFASASGTAQNLGYALQWPLFAGFALFAYFRFVRLEQESDTPDTSVPGGVTADDPATAGTGSPLPGSTSGARAGLITGRRTTTAHAPREIPAGFLPERPRATRDDDPVLAEYNSYLARLNTAGSTAGAPRDTERSAG
ncbi:transcriptional regulator [Nocardia sp. NBC_00416]|uniref:transcriptional regulator n=1 Tax=Nocardia sp. NBC_00416 TaxID=2975991 RepID=UPI0030DE6B94